MEEIELVIKIPEEIYQHYKKVWQKRRGSIPESCIAFGIPLPKGHGDLIDRDKVSSKLVSLIRKFYKMFPTERLHSNVDRAKINELRYCINIISEESAIIPADKEQLDVLDKIRAEILEEKECAYADFEQYKVEYLGQDWEDALDSLPQDDFRYGMERCIDIIDKYRAESEE